MKEKIKLIGSMKIQPGCKLFCFDPANDHLSVVEPEVSTVKDDKGKEVTKKILQYDKRFIYVQAINEKNAERKLLKFKKK